MCYVHLHAQNWQYPRNQLVYMRELGEGQFGKVLLMKAQVCNYVQYVHCIYLYNYGRGSIAVTTISP